jgi:hypothetical protein
MDLYSWDAKKKDNLNLTTMATQRTLHCCDPTQLVFSSLVGLCFIIDVVTAMQISRWLSCC